MLPMSQSSGVVKDRRIHTLLTNVTSHMSFRWVTSNNINIDRIYIYIYTLYCIYTTLYIYK